MSTTEAIGAETPEATTDQRTKFIEGLRELADFIEGNEAVPVPSFETTINVPVGGKPELASFARVAGKADKNFAGDWAIVRKQFGPLAFDVYANRAQVCEQVQVGTETITEEVPDPEQLAEIPTVTVTREEPVYEWRCDEPLLATQRTAAQDDPRGERDA